MLKDEIMKKNKIDAMLRCILLRWQRTEKDRNKLSSAREFGLTPIDFFRASVQIVKRNTMFEVIDKDDERSITHFEMIAGTGT